MKAVAAITTPKITLTTSVAQLQTELAAYDHLFDSLWQRHVQKENYQTYLQGLILAVPNKSMETMLMHLKGNDPRAIRNMPHFMSKGGWQGRAVFTIHWREVAKDLRDETASSSSIAVAYPKLSNNTRKWNSRNLCEKLSAPVVIWTTLRALVTS